MSFVYHEPDSLEEAIGLLTTHGADAVLLGGGTAFALLMQKGFLPQGHVVGLRRIQDLQGIEAREEGLWVGASASHSDVARSPLVAEHHPVLAETYHAVATVRIRNQATVGGGLAHADPAQDPPVSLLALGASVRIAGPGGTRDLPLEEFFTFYFSTVLGDDEIVLGFTVPPARRIRATFTKFLPRSIDDYATVNVAAAGSLDEAGNVASVKVALGGVAPTPVRARSVEEALHGAVPSPSALDEASALVRDDIDPIDDVRGSGAYKAEMARVFVRRALTAVLAAPGAGGLR